MEIWKYYAETGGANKERMVTITTWLLALSATAIGFAVTHYIEFNTALQVKQEERAVATVLAVLGLFISFTGILIILLCAGYSNRNWALADALARKYNLRDLLPDVFKDKEEVSPKGLNSFVLYIVDFLSRPKDPRISLPLVFWLFLVLAVISFLLHAILFIIAVN